MAKKSNVSKWIEHCIKRELYGNGTKERVIELLENIYDRILKELEKSSFISTKTEYRKILSHIDEMLSEYSGDYRDILSEQIIEISKFESKWVQDFMKELGKDFIIPASLLTSLKFSPVATSSNYEQLVESSVSRIKTNVDNVLRTAYLTKENLSESTSRLSSKLSKEIKNVNSDVEVFNTTAFSMTDYLMFRTNKEQVRYSAILDSSTCIACGDMDGKIFEIKNAPILPIHYNCRCYLQPIELDNEGIENYKDWFEQQDEQTKRDILGKTRYELYKDKNIEISTFSNNGEILNLDDLSEKTKGVIITNEQFGKKVGKHARDFGLDPSLGEDREKFRNIIREIINKPDYSIESDNWRGYENIRYIVKGNNILLVNPKDDSFITMLENGINNKRFLEAKGNKA